MTRVQNVNQTDIPDAIRLATKTMQSVFDADDNNTPFFHSLVRPTANLEFYQSFSEAHVPGRHLNALLNAEDTIGVEIPDWAIENHARAAFFSYSGPVALPLNRDVVGGTLKRFLPHNLREGFHALFALTAFRNSPEAQKIAERSIADIDRYWNEENGWDRATLEGEYGLEVIEWGGPFITGIARAIGPLVKYYRVTGSPAARALIDRLAAKTVADYFTVDGSFDYSRWGSHTHSTTCVMSSLAQLAELDGNDTLLERVAIFYDNGLRFISDELGWSIENCAPEANSDRGEANNTGDILETALILGKMLDPRYFQDVERILRGHLLPSQLRDVSWIIDPPNPEGIDGLRDVANRHLGAFGFPAPYGHAPLDYEEIRFNMDIVGGATGSLCEAWRSTVRQVDGVTLVNMLFDYDDDSIQVESPYPSGLLRITPRIAQSIAVRIPSWVDADATVAAVPGGAFHDNGHWLTIDSPTPGETISIPMPLVEETIVLEHRARSIGTRLAGDAVVAMDNFGADLTFFPER